MGREVGFENQKAYDESKSGDRAERYSAKMGRRDIIRVVSTAISYRLHWVNSTKRYGECGIDDDGNGSCMICKQDAEPDEKFGCLIILVAQREGDSWKPVNKIMFWGFGGDKYRQLFDLNEDLGDIKKMELLVSCSDTKMQKLNFSQWTKDSMLDASKITKDMVEHGKKWLKIYTSPSDEKRQRYALGLEGGGDADEGAASLPAALVGGGDDDIDFSDAGVDPTDDVSSIIDEIGDI